MSCAKFFKKLGALLAEEQMRRDEYTAKYLAKKFNLKEDEVKRAIDEAFLEYLENIAKSDEK